MKMNRYSTALLLSSLTLILSSCAAINPEVPKSSPTPVLKPMTSTSYEPSGYSVVDSMNKYQIPNSFKISKLDHLDRLELTIDMTGIDPYDLSEHLLGSVTTTCANDETDMVELTIVLDGAPGEPSTYLCSDLLG